MVMRGWMMMIPSWLERQFGGESYATDGIDNQREAMKMRPWLDKGWIREIPNRAGAAKDSLEVRVTRPIVSSAGATDREIKNGDRAGVAVWVGLGYRRY